MALCCVRARARALGGWRRTEQSVKSSSQVVALGEMHPTTNCRGHSCMHGLNDPPHIHKFIIYEPI